MALEPFVVEAQDLIEQSREHLLVINQDLLDLAQNHAYDSDIFKKLDEARRRLEDVLAETEGVLRNYYPEQFGKKHPPFAAEMPKFTKMLGLPSINRATSRGPEVENLQRILVWEGYSIPIDGDYTPKTQQALMDWQKHHGINLDGIVGASTRQALNALLNGEE